MQFLSENTVTVNSGVSSNFPLKSENYADILDYYGLEFIITEPYLQIGEITKTQGWILHISVVISQVTPLLETIIPELIKESVPFKIPTDKDITRNLLGGNLGIDQVGKVMSIYPETDEDAYKLARKLITLTQTYTGPIILTDAYLGGAVYCRYGSFNPVMRKDTNGKITKHIYTAVGKLTKDPYSIPFRLADGIIWPFKELPISTSAHSKKLLSNKYLIPYLLKSDVKGNVYRGFYMKGLFIMAGCVVKAGNKNALSEDNGRTIYDRLLWQYELHKELRNELAVPEIIDFFQENGDTYLVTELIKGHSLYDKLKSANFNKKSWLQVNHIEQQKLVEYLLKTIAILSRFHQLGYVHRDMSPGNFIINRQEEIVLIDLELAYSINKATPFPPFEYGTYGFISPQQQAGVTPCPTDDVYGLGAIMVVLFTGLSPVKFNAMDPEVLISNLNFFTNDCRISDIIAACLHYDPLLRPSLSIIQYEIEQYRAKLNSIRSEAYQQEVSAIVSKSELKTVIDAAINGLIVEPTVVLNDLWYSKYSNSDSEVAYVQKEYIRYVGVYEGIGGVLYLLGKAKYAGFNIDTCMVNYEKGWSFILDNYINKSDDTTKGLYRGAVGIALSVKEGIQASLLGNNDHYRSIMQACLTQPVEGLDVHSGLAGKGIALLQCAPFLGQQFCKQELNQIVQTLVDQQKGDGSWRLGDVPGSIGNRPISFAYGVPGITWFLLAYNAKYEDKSAREAALSSVLWLLKTTKNLKDLYNRKKFKKMSSGPEVGDERKGAILTIIKAYEIFRNEDYKKVATEALLMYPSQMVKNDFSQHSGLSGMGELYLEAFQIFGDQIWKQRAEWLAGVLIHTFFHHESHAGFWRMEERNDPTADFMIGTSGIIHFLLRMYDPGKLGYRLLQ